MKQTSGQKENLYFKKIGGFEMKQFIKNLLNKRLNNEKGLTLIELLAVIVILGIISAIAIPAIGNIINDSKIKGIKADAANIINAAQLYYANGGTPNSFNGTAGKGAEYVSNFGSISKTDLSVSSAGEISGTGTRDGVSIKFTSASIDEIKPESTAELTGVVEITP